MKSRCETHQSDYTYPWEYCRSEDMVEFEFNKRIQCLKQRSYECITTMDEYIDDLKQLKFKQISLNLGKDSELDFSDSLIVELQEEAEQEYEPEETEDSEAEIEDTGYNLRNNRNVNCSELICYHKLTPMSVENATIQ